MHFINPFKGLRPTEEKASSVSIPSTDQLSQEVIVNHKKKNPWSYLNIFNPDSKNSKSQNANPYHRSCTKPLRQQNDTPDLIYPDEFQIS